MNYGELAKKALSKKEFQNLTPEFVRWEEKGQSIVGSFQGRMEVTSGLNQGSYSQYIFDTDDGLIKFSLGSLADKEVGNRFEQGSIYYIEFLGKQKIPGGHQVNRFKILQLMADGTEPEGPAETDIF